MPNFSDDCLQCKALCCIATGRDDDGFGNNPDCAVGEPCRELTDEYRCRAHGCFATNSAYSGCAGYSCMGAGNDLSDLLKFAGIHNPLHPANASEHLIVSVVYQIFKYCDETKHVIDNLVAGEDRTKYETQYERLLEAFQLNTQSGGNVAIFIPQFMALFDELADYQKAHVLNPSKIVRIKGGHVLFRLGSCVNLETLKRPNNLLTEEIQPKGLGGSLAPNIKRKLVFSMFLLGVSYFGNDELWQWVQKLDQEGELKEEFDRACLEYAGCNKPQKAQHILDYVWNRCAGYTYEKPSRGEY